jgi:hypothetical protein
VQRALYQLLTQRQCTRGSVGLYGAIVALTLTAARSFQWTTLTVIVSLVIPIAMMWAVHEPVRSRRGPG